MTNPALQPRWRLASAAIGTACLLAGASGCVVHSVNEDPEPALAEGVDEKGFVNDPAAEVNPAGKARKSEAGWWRSFRDPNLGKLIEEGLAENPDVRAVERRIDQANARLVQAGSTLFPQLDGAGDFQRRWNLEGDRSADASLGLVLDWELDAWGRIRSGRSARAEEAVAAWEDWRSARLLLSGAVAEAWFELLEQRGQLELAEEQIKVGGTLLDLTRLRFGQGQSSIVDVKQQQEQLESIESRVPDIEERIKALELVLDTLVGQMPGSRKRLSGMDEPDSPPPLPKAGFPVDLLAERPDLRAQRARILARDHEVGEAIADRLPRISIGGSLAAAGTPSVEKLVGDAIAGAVGPIFDAGSRKAEVSRRRSRLAEEVDRYSAAFLDAVREVETALSRETKLAERTRRQEKQLATARILLTESRNRYTLAATDYLPVLDAVSKVQELERDLLTSRRERLSARVALHRALGGPMPDPER